MSGKTTLMQSLLAPLRSVVVIDSKHNDADWVAFAQSFGYVISADPADIRRHERVVFRVDAGALADITGWRKPGAVGFSWTEALRSIIWRRDTVAVFDEAMHSLPSTAVHLDARRISTQGAGLGLGAWFGTQAPLFVDTVALSQSEHMFAFASNVDEYLVSIRRLRGIDAELLRGLGSHEFAHHRKGDPGWAHFAPIEPVILRTRYANSDLSATPPDLHTAALTESEAPGEAPPHVAQTAPREDLRP
jgi:hypothetical protein